MKLYNPTEQTVRIVYLGTEYVVSPKSYTDELEAEVSAHWAKVHEFLVTDAEIEAVKKEPAKKEVKESVKEVEQETVSVKVKTDK